jgi:hypothetical protein
MMVPGEADIHRSVQDLLTAYARDHQLRFATDTYHDVRWYKLAWWARDRQNLIKLWLMPDGLQMVLQHQQRYEGWHTMVEWLLQQRHPNWYRVLTTLPLRCDQSTLYRTLDEARQELEAGWLQRREV